MRYGVVLLAVLFVTCKDRKKEAAVLYNDAIVKAVNSSDSVIQVLFAFEMFDQFPQIQENYNEIFTRSLTQLKNITPIEGDDTLRQSATELIETYQSILNDDFSNIYQIMHDSVYTAIDSARVDSLMLSMYTKWELHSRILAAQQTNFAKRYAITLE